MISLIEAISQYFEVIFSIMIVTKMNVKVKMTMMIKEIINFLLRSTFRLMFAYQLTFVYNSLFLSLVPSNISTIPIRLKDGKTVILMSKSTELLR